MRNFGRAMLGFAAGVLVALVAGFGLPSVLPISQAEGAYAMGVAFFWAPLGGIIGAVAAVLFWPKGRAP